MKPIYYIYVALFVALLLIGAQVYAQVNTGNSSLPTGSYGKKDTFNTYEKNFKVNENGVSRETIRVERNKGKDAVEGDGQGTRGISTTQNTDGTLDTAVISDGTQTDTAAIKGLDIEAGDNANCNTMTSLYIALVLLSIALLVGGYLISNIWKGQPTNQIAGSAYAVLLPISTAIVAFFTMQCTGPSNALIALVIAVLIGLPMFFMRTVSKPSPKGLIIAHGIAAVAGYALLIAYVATK
jgi:hypothetical protein